MNIFSLFFISVSNIQTFFMIVLAYHAIQVYKYNPQKEDHIVLRLNMDIRSHNLHPIYLADKLK